MPLNSRRTPLGVAVVLCCVLLPAGLFAGSYWTDQVFVQTGSGCAAPATGTVVIRKHGLPDVLATPAVDRYGNVTAWLEPQLVDITYPHGVVETARWICTQPATPTVAATGPTPTATPTVTGALTATPTRTPTPTVTATPGCNTLLLVHQPALGSASDLAASYTGGTTGLATLRQRVSNTGDDTICRVDLCLGNAPAGNPTPGTGQTMHVALYSDDPSVGCGLTACPLAGSGADSSTVATSLPGIVRDAPFDGSTACGGATGYGTLVSFTFASPVTKSGHYWVALVNDTLAQPVRWAAAAGESHGGLGFNGWAGSTDTTRDFALTVWGTL